MSESTSRSERRGASASRRAYVRRRCARRAAHHRSASSSCSSSAGSSGSTTSSWRRATRRRPGCRKLSRDSSHDAATPRPTRPAPGPTPARPAGHRRRRPTASDVRRSSSFRGSAPTTSVPIAEGIGTTQTLNKRRRRPLRRTQMPGSRRQLRPRRRTARRTAAPFANIARAAASATASTSRPSTGWYKYMFRNLEYVQADAVQVLQPVPEPRRSARRRETGSSP